LNAYDQLNDHFLLLYGDNYWPIELDDMRFNYQQLNAAVTTTVFSNKKGTGEYGFRNNVVVGNDGFVVKYDKKQETDAANGVDMGYFLIAKEALDPEMSGNVSFEEDILPKLIVKKQLGAYVTDTQYHYITNMDTLKSFETAVKENSFVPLPQNYFIKS
jgi:D-glycero-D-manno-heptose 1,7-bisphosphate phosphatase